MTNEELRNQFKSDIRSVLIAARNGFTSTELTRDYKEFVGDRIPYTELGFSNLHSILESMSDVCTIERSNGEVRYHAVPDESTKNLKKLVSRQKTQTKKRKGGGGSRFSGHSTWRKPTYASRTSAGFYGNKSSTASYPNRHTSTASFASTYNYGSISDYPSYRSYGSAPSYADKASTYASTAYAQAYGNQISASTYPNKADVPSYANKIAAPAYPNKSAVSSYANKSAAQPYTNSVSEKLPAPISNSTRFSRPDSVSRDLNVKNGNESNKPNPSTTVVQCLSRHPKGVSLTALKNEVEQKSKGTIKYKTIDDLQSHLLQLSSSVSFDQIMGKAWLKSNSNNLDFTSSVPVQPPPGFMPAAIPPSFKVKQNNDIVGNLRQPPATSFQNKIVAEAPQFLPSVKLSEADEIIIKDRILRIIKDHPNGINVKILDVLYCDRHNIHLKIGEYKSLVEFLSTMRNIQINKVNDDEYASFQSETDHSALKANHNLKLVKPIQPTVSGFAELDSRFTELPIPDLEQVFSGVIVTFYSVEDLFIQRSETKLQCQELFDSMKTFYSLKGPGDTKETMIPVNVLHDLPSEFPCAVFWRSAWYRGYMFGSQIQSYEINNITMSVRLVDVGIVDTVNIQFIRRLAIRFMKFPVHVMRARLSGILKTVNNDFLTHKCRSYVERLTFRRQLSARIVQCNRTDYRSIGRIPVAIHMDKCTNIENHIPISDLAAHLLNCGLVIEDTTIASNQSSTDPSRISSTLKLVNMHRTNIDNSNSINKNSSQYVDENTSNLNGLSSQLKKCLVFYEQRCDTE